MSKPHWLPLPELLSAQAESPVVFSAPQAIEQGLAICGWQLNTAFVERLNLRASAFDLSC